MDIKHPYILDFSEIDSTSGDLAGGKGANLGELALTEGINVPDGFCITTAAYKRITEHHPLLNSLLDALSNLKTGDLKQISAVAARIRTAIEETPVPADIADAVADQLLKFGEKDAFAVRSSATAEDLPAASFAGQQDSYLNIIGKQAILMHVSKCWASLFTDRAIVYRLQNGFDHRQVRLAVVIQQMIFPQVSGILFTADPVSGDRKLLSINAAFGLGESIVSGLVNADIYKLRNGSITEKKIFAKKLAIHARKDGGTDKQAVDAARQKKPALTDRQIIQLAGFGRKVEDHFLQPQDIEWCLADGVFYIVQSRPVTTLYPIPVANDGENHVYISVAHQQMMTDAIKPLGLSFFQLNTAAPMREAGGRLFVDVTSSLASPVSRKKILNMLRQSDPLMGEALTEVSRRKHFIKPPENKKITGGAQVNKVMSWKYPANFDNNPVVVSNLIRRNQDSIAALKQNIQGKSGTALFDFILDDIQQSKKALFSPENLDIIMVPMYAASWINKKMILWLNEKKAADTIALSAPNNITAEMGLDLLDVADLIRPYPEIIDYLQKTNGENFPGDLASFRGGGEIRDALTAFLTKYGMRCAGEIDITKTRWLEKPATLIPAILSNVRNFEPGASRRKFDEGRGKSIKKEEELLERLRFLPDGKRKADETKRMISIIRNFTGYREYPKYGLVSRSFVYRQALLKEAEHLVQHNVIHEKEDIYYLRFEELRELVSTHKPDYGIIQQRKAEFKLFEKLTPPRVITSDGEIITGSYKRKNLPDGAIIGLAVSSGLVEGRARVILTMADADLEEGDILVTAFTDPSWTPLFVSIKGLVTEVGGLMTHGAVIAREYGLPAIVGVEHATRLIRDGQRIRVNGTDGYIEIL